MSQRLVAVATEIQAASTVHALAGLQAPGKLTYPRRRTGRTPAPQTRGEKTPLFMVAIVIGQVEKPASARRPS